MCAQVLSCVRLFCNPMDCSPPRSSVRGIFQARILQWVAISFSSDYFLSWHFNTYLQKSALCSPVFTSSFTELSLISPLSIITLMKSCQSVHFPKVLLAASNPFKVFTVFFLECSFNVSECLPLDVLQSISQAAPRVSFLKYRSITILPC